MSLFKKCTKLSMSLPLAVLMLTALTLSLAKLKPIRAASPFQIPSYSRTMIGGLTYTDLTSNYKANNNTLGASQLFTQTCVQPPNAMIGWWSGDVDTTDISGNSNDAQLQNGAQAAIPGKVAGAFSFDGVDDTVSTPVFVPPRGTLDLWLNPTSLEDIHGIIGTFGKANGNDRLWITARGPVGGLGVDPNKIVVNIGSCCVNEIIADSPLITGTWTHLALTFDYLSDNYTLYLNGQAVASSTVSRDAPTEALGFGGFSSNFGQSFFLNGLTDEVEIFDRVLEASEIQAIYNADSMGKCKVPKLSVTKLASPDPVQAGEPLTYTLFVTNVGRGNLQATITDLLPTQISSGQTPSGSAILPGGILTWTALISFPTGIWSRTVVVTPEHDYFGVLTNVVQVSTQEGARGIYTVTSVVNPRDQTIYLPLVMKGP